MARNKILIDADIETKQRKLLRSSPECQRPDLRRDLQRKGNEGFGERNFQPWSEQRTGKLKRGFL